jgi:signal transduction histidine kinase
MSGAAGRRAALRDGLLFLVAGVLPAVAAVALGLRAVRNEEAALRREAAAETEAAADRARRSIEQEIATAEGLLAALAPDVMPAAPAQRRQMMRSLAPPWAEPAVFDARLEPVLSDTPPARDAAQATARDEGACRAAGREIQRERAMSRDQLVGCDTVRTELGLLVVPAAVLAVLAERDDVDAYEVLLDWLSRHGDRLRPAEEQATREEIDASQMTADQKKAARAALDGMPSTPSRLTTALGGESVRAALRRGPDRTGMVRWRGDGTLGAVRITADGSAGGFVVDATGLGRAVHPDPAAPTEIRVVAAAPPATDAPRAVVWLAPGLGLEARLRGGEDLSSRARRSRLVLWAIAGGSAAVAMAVAAVLFARLRAARRTSELRTSFAAAVSHELRTPIASIRMLAELLEDERGGDEAERKETATAIARESRRLGETVSRLLAWSRMSAGQTDVLREPAVLAEVVGDAVEVFEERHPEVKVERSFDDALSIAIDAALVQLAVMNLLENARKYAPKGEPYRVVVTATERGARIEVEDRGPGVPRGMRGRIFEAFERGDDRLSRATEGTGIGLALVRAVAQAHGGDATVEAASEGGARFTIELTASRGRTLAPS